MAYPGSFIETMLPGSKPYLAAGSISAMGAYLFLGMDPNVALVVGVSSMAGWGAGAIINKDMRFNMAGSALAAAGGAYFMGVNPFIAGFLGGAAGMAAMFSYGF